MPDDGQAAYAITPANDTNQPIQPSSVTCTLKVGEPDERGNTVKYIYSCDQDYIVYYSRLEHRSANADAEQHARTARGMRRLMSRPRFEPGYESEGVQAQLSADPTKRPALRRLLLPLGTERAKLQALLSGWQRRQSYDSSIATALQLALDGGDTAEAKENALQILKDAREGILSEREIAGRAQYVKFTLLLGLCGLLLLGFAQHNLFKDAVQFWLGVQAGLIGAVLSIAIGLSRRTVALDIGIARNLCDSGMRLVIGAVSGGTLVLLFSTGLLPSLHTATGVQDGGKYSIAFALLLGIIAGFVEQLVPSLLESQAQRMGEGGAAKPPAAGKVQ